VNKIAKVVVGLPIEGPFDYWVDETLRAQIAVGKRVRIPFGDRKCIGYVVGQAAKSHFPRGRLKSILSVIDSVPILSDELLQLTREVSGYYGCSWGEAIETSLPKALRSGTAVDLPVTKNFLRQKIPPGQIILLQNLNRKQGWDFLLENIRKTIAAEQDVIVLVPEISVLHFTVEMLKSVSDKVIVLDRKLAAKEELNHWLKAKTKEAKIVLGTRSAVFAPVDHLGLMIVLEEDHPAYKQEQSPFYHGRDVALMRARRNDSRIILENIAPCPEVWWQAKKGKMKLMSFAAEKSADMQIVDVTDYKSRKSVLVSVPLRNAIEKTVRAEGKVILFLNRKGFSTMTKCPQCQFILQCPRCETNLSYLYAQKKMTCGHCNYTGELPDLCPQCRSSYLRSSGVGIEKLESELARIFPQYRLGLYDRDTKNLPAQFDILIATQAVLRLQNQFFAQLIGAVHMDSELNRSDFRSAHKTFSLLIQLRQMTREKFIVQTRLPDNYCFKAAAKMDFKGFYREEIKFRRQLSLPPFNHLVSIIVRATKEGAAFDQTNILYRKMQDTLKRGIMVTEAQPDAMPKLRGKYRFMILVKGKSAEKILLFVRASLKGIKRKSGAIISEEYLVSNFIETLHERRFTLKDFYESYIFWQ